MRRGFTLIEMIFILGIVTIFAAILIPLIEKTINDAKITRAVNEVQVIASGMVNFYKDVCRWPNTRKSDLSPNLYLLYGEGSVGTYDGDGCGSSGNLCKGWWNIISRAKDTFTNQLIQNTLGGYPSRNYPTSGSCAWRGPYLRDVKPDPWGHHYSCNIRYTWPSISTWFDRALYVWSAGPDGQADTRIYQYKTNAHLYDDDIGVRLR